jgi:hypothetical protein
MKRENAQQYQKLFQDVRKILNRVDPEELGPGTIGGAPTSEYDAETALILSYVVHNQEDIQVNDHRRRRWPETLG